MKKCPLSWLQTLRFLLIGWMLVWLSACGGSSGGGSQTDNRTQAPVITSTSTSVAGTTSVSPAVGETVVFATTVQGGSGNYAYSWYFGDGSEVLAGQSVEHTYSSPNTYSVKLIVTDTDTGLNTDSQFDLVVSAALSAEIASIVPAKPVVGANVVFSAAAAGGVGDYTYAWDFGDGVTTTGITSSHTFATAGSFTVTLTVKDSSGKTATASTAVTVGAGLGATITAPATLIAGTAASFTGAGIGGTGSYSSYSWNFGDGTAAATGAKPSHTFATAGSFTVTLTVKDSSGKTATATQAVTVNYPTLTVAITQNSPANPDTGVTVSFAGLAGGGSGSYTYAWTFGDTSTGNGASVSHAYSAKGTYTVTLTVTDTVSNQTTQATSATVYVYAPLTATIGTPSPATPKVNQNMSLSGSGSGGKASYTAYAWDFGDGTTGSGTNVTHTYTKMGPFTVTLTVTDSRGITAPRTKAVTTLPIDYTSGTVKYRGVNLSGAEWGGFPKTPLPVYPYYPNQMEATYFSGKNMNLMRFPFRWERLQPTLNGALDATELTKIKTSVNYALAAGQYVVLDQHNSARYAPASTEYLVGSAEVPVSAFANFWGKLAAEYKNEPRVMFGLTNEPYDIKFSTLVSAYNAAIVAIRATGAKNTVFVSGNQWSSASAWNNFMFVGGEPNSNGLSLLGVTDSGNNLVFEAHQYLDQAGTGYGTECYSSTVGADKLSAFTSWLKTSGKRGYLGEFGAPNTTTCQTAVTGMLQHMKDNASVYVGWSWWAAGAGWGKKDPLGLNIEPYDDGSDDPKINWLVPFLQ
jgi:endoglucanase